MDASTDSARILSGMRPTGSLHIGNYFGAIKQFLELQRSAAECYFFIADYHALTEATGPTQVGALTLEVAKSYVAAGIDPSQCVLYRQSDVPEIFCMATLLGNMIGLGTLQRCTTFKDRVLRLGRRADEVSYGLLGYPVLMAIDILGVRADRVPVGEDQRQHVEMTRDFAIRFNHTFKSEVFTIPRMHLQQAERVPGIDGSEKMGKSEGNTISLLESDESIIRKVRRIPTQGGPITEQSPGTRALFEFVRLACPPDTYDHYRRRAEAGEDRFFAGMKDDLIDALRLLVGNIREHHASLSDDAVVRILQSGSERARETASAVLTDMQQAIGFRV
jgi:tryptophanyl-tRNA synthetase